MYGCTALCLASGALDGVSKLMHLCVFKGVYFYLVATISSIRIFTNKIHRSERISRCKHRSRYRMRWSYHHSNCGGIWNIKPRLEQHLVDRGPRWTPCWVIQVVFVRNVETVWYRRAGLHSKWIEQFCNMKTLFLNLFIAIYVILVTLHFVYNACHLFYRFKTSYVHSKLAAILLSVLQTRSVNLNCLRSIMLIHISAFYTPRVM